MDSKHAIDTWDAFVEDIFRLAISRPPNMHNSQDMVVIDAWHKRIKFLLADALAAEAERVRRESAQLVADYNNLTDDAFCEKWGFKEFPYDEVEALRALADKG